MTTKGATHVAIDARELAGHVTGPGVYLLNLLRHWLSRDDVRLTLIAHQPLAAEVDALPNIARAARVLRPDAKGGTLWEQLVLPRAVGTLGASVLFSPAYTAPLATRLPTVVAVHDVSYAAHPEWFRPSERLRRNAVSRLAARRAARVTTLSAFSAGEIARLFRVDRTSIAVIPPGAPARVPAPSGAAREPLIVYVGSIFNRRHVPVLVDAFARVARARPDARLFLAGANRTWPRQDLAAAIAASGVAPRITWREDASNADVAAALSRASAAAFLSEYEGFAMTPFEALAHGVPSVLLDTPAAREVYGDAALLIDRPDAAAAASALQRLLDEPATRAALVARGDRLWERYDWARSADAMLDVLREAAR